MRRAKTLRREGAFFTASVRWHEAGGVACFIVSSIGAIEAWGSAPGTFSFFTVFTVFSISSFSGALHGSAGPRRARQADQDPAM
jgi:hypothetical protein